MSLNTYYADNVEFTPVSSAEESDIKSMQILYTTNQNETFILDIQNPTRQVRINVQKGKTDEKEETELIRTTLEVFSDSLDFRLVHGNASVNTFNFRTITSVTTGNTEEPNA